ncbi:MAG: trimeric intracellular cation channel family protein [Sphingobacteriales bacterium]|nr:trimeric intracellular cation channel family protein [Sphingobacteriales bacterium]MBI3718234.1 trimeric intracellular cation channel family protein [Sphingobacteriales bacterium]
MKIKTVITSPYLHYMNLLQWIAYTGTFVFALTGAFKARTFKMDIFGGIVLAFVTAYGGGTLRDLLIGIRPVNWVNDNIALALVFSGTVFTFLLKENVNRFKRSIFYTDAIGIGLFTAAGIEVSLHNGLNEIYALVMGVITATFGGLIADIFCNAVPSLLKRGELYATACAIGGAVYLLLKKIPLEYNTNLFICVLVVVGIRIYSKRKRLTLPEI